MPYLAKYGVAFKVRIPDIKRSANDFANGTDWPTPAAGDSQISKDGGAFANTTNLIALSQTMGSTRGGATWEISLTATEMQAAEIVVMIVDASTKLVEDQTVTIQTYGHASAAMAFDLGTATVVASSVTALGAGAINAAAISADTGLKIRSGTAQAGAASTITLDAGASATDSLYKGAVVVVTGGTGAGQHRIITGYVGSTKVATVGEAWETAPDNTSTFMLLPGRAFVSTVLAAAITAIQSGLATSAALATVQADTDDIQTRLPAALQGGRMDSSVGAMAADVLTAAAIATDAFGSLELATGAATEIATAVWAQSMSELSGVPAPNASVLAGLEWLLVVARGVREQTALGETIFKDDGVTVIGTSAKTNDGTTFRRPRYT